MKKTKKVLTFVEYSWEELPIEYRRLVEAAEKVRDEAYNPYSKFYVGAALLTTSGEIITGANVENASYGVTICAERSALFNANSMGKRKIKAIAIITRGENFDTEEPTAPCGACRQAIYEFSQISGVDITVIYANTKKDRIIVTTISQLLPGAFGPTDLGIDVKKYR